MLWLNSKEYCLKYKISNTTLKRWSDQGKIKVNKISDRKFLYLDPVNASIEIARRGYNVIILKNKQFYPSFELKDSLIHQWKEMVKEMPDKWKELFVLIKNLKLRYRVSTNDVVFRKFITNKSMILSYQFDLSY